MNILFDEAGAPSMRSVFGSLLTHSQRADIALANMRLAALDLTDDEIGTVRLRILLGRFEAGTVGSFGGHTERLDGLRRLLASDRVQIRSAGIGHWIPDFSVFRALASPRAPREACLIGAHYFHEPPSSTGPSFTCVFTDDASVATASARFEAVWENGYDIRSVVDDALRRMVRPG